MKINIRSVDDSLQDNSSEVLFMRTWAGSLVLLLTCISESAFSYEIAQVNRFRPLFESGV